jgi:hypothetical protein
MSFPLLSKIFLLIFIANGVSIIAANKANDKSSPVFSPVSIIDVKAGKSIVRTVWHPANLTSYTLDMLFPGTRLVDIASNALHKEAAAMQQKAGLALDRPLFVMEHKRTACTWHSRCYIIGLAPEDCHSPDALKRSVVIGHEIGHLVLNGSFSRCLTSRNAREMHTWAWYGAWIGYTVGLIPGTIHTVGLISGVLAGKKRSYTLNATIILATVLYGFSRWKAAVSSLELHKEEFFCDRFSIETFGNTPQEKIARAQAFIRYFVGDLNYSHFTLLNWFYRASNWFDGLLFTSTHPAHSKRIAQFHAYIKEQESAIHQAEQLQEGVPLCDLH